MRQFEYATSCVSFNGYVSYLHDMKLRWIRHQDVNLEKEEE